MGLPEKAGDYCLQGNAESCLLWVQFAGDSGNPRFARETLARSCEKSDPKYCPFATRIEFRLGAIADATKHGQRGCSAQIGSSCHDLGILAFQQEDHSLAAISLQKACQDGIEVACLDKGLVARSQGKDAQAIFESSCQETKSPIACDLAAIDSEKKADANWRTNIEILCKKGSARDCYLATLDQYYRPGGKNLAKFRFAHQCAQPEGAESCFMKLRNENPLGFRTSQTDELKQLCGSGSKLACYAVESATEESTPTLHVRTVSPEELADSCEKGHYPESCEEKAKLAFEKKDPATAEYFMDKACQFGSEDACTWTANQLMERKEISPTEKERARDLFGRACLGGSVFGCEKRLELSRTL